MDLISSIFTNNSALGDGGGRDLYHRRHSTVPNFGTHIHYNIMDLDNYAVVHKEGTWTTLDNLTENPDEQMDDGSYKLAAGSNSIDRGAQEFGSQSINGPPVAESQTVTLDEDSVNHVIVLKGSDPYGDPLTYTVDEGGPTNGTWSGNLPDLSYTPDPDYYGNDSITPQLHKKDGKKGEITITIVSVEDLPLATDRSVSIGVDSKDTPITCIGSDSDNDPLTYTVGSGPSHGTLDHTEIPILHYTPYPDFTGTDTITYTVMEDDNHSDTATVTITVQDDTGGSGGGGGGGCFVQHLFKIKRQCFGRGLYPCQPH